MKYDLLATECVSKMKNLQFSAKDFFSNIFHINRLINWLRFFWTVPSSNDIQNF
jgi:hypothetical protein